MAESEEYAPASGASWARDALRGVLRTQFMIKLLRIVGFVALLGWATLVVANVWQTLDQISSDTESGGPIFTGASFVEDDSMPDLLLVLQSAAAATSLLVPAALAFGAAALLDLRVAELLFENLDDEDDDEHDSAAGGAILER